MKKAVADVLRSQLQLHQLFFGRPVVGLAIGANSAHQALGDDRLQRRCHQKRLQPEVYETRDRRRGIVRVQRREYQVSGQRSLHRDLGGFQVTNFADQDDIRVLSQEASQGTSKGQAHVGPNLDLDEPVDVILDRILGG